MLKKITHIFSVFILILFSVLPTEAQKKKPGSPSVQPSADARLRQAEIYFTEGQKYFILEDNAKALQYFEKSAELNPTNGTVHYKIAEIFSKSNREDELLRAAQSIETALKYEKKNKYFYLLASNIHAGLGNLSKATAALETMLKEINGTEEYLYELAALYLYDKKNDEAIKAYNRAETTLGISEVSSLQKQQIYIDQNNVDRAIEEGEKLVEAFPDEERYVLGFAETLSRLGKIEKAIEYVESYIKNHPEASSSKMLLAGFYRDSGQEKKSREYVLAVFEDSSIDVSSKLMMIRAYASTIVSNKEKKIVDADLESFTVSLFKKVEERHPQESNVHLIGGDLFLTLGKDLEALTQYRSAIKGGTASFEAWQNMLYLESQSSQLDSLLKHSEEALELFPNQAMAYYFNGHALVRKKNFRDGAYALEQAKKLSANNPEFMSELNSMLGDAYQGAKEYGKSNAAYDEALAINPNNDVVLNNYSYYLSLRKENLEKADKMSAQLVKLFPDNVSYLDTRAWVLYSMEKYKEARKVMERVIQTGQATATHLEHYGDILFQLQDIDLAVKQWQLAKQKGSTSANLDKKISNRKLN